MALDEREGAARRSEEKERERCGGRSISCAVTRTREQSGAAARRSASRLPSLRMRQLGDGARTRSGGSCAARQQARRARARLWWPPSSVAAGTDEKCQLGTGQGEARRAAAHLRREERRRV